MKLHKYPSDNNNFGSIRVNPLNLGQTDGKTKQTYPHK
jgi:hypothetical protein